MKLAPSRLESVLFWHWKPNSSDKPTVYAFDLDQTLVTSKSGAKFPKGPWDWRWQTPTTRELVRKAAEFATIVIFTNQGGVVPDPAKKSYQNIDGRVNQVLESLDLPNVRVFAACKNPSNPEFRKPNAGMWRLFAEKYAPTVPDLEKSVFVGDAAGRKQDHSDADIGFAKAAGLRFLLPEDFCAETAALPSDKSQPKQESPTEPEPAEPAPTESEPTKPEPTKPEPTKPEPGSKPSTSHEPRLNPEFPIMAPKKKAKLEVKNN